MKLKSIIVKNLKLLLQHKGSALSVLLGPLLLIILAGVAFNTSSFQNVVIGVSADNFDSVLNSFTDKIEEHFTVKKFSSISECNDFLKSDKVNMCIGYNSSVKEVTFYVNPARMNLVYSLLNAMSRQMNYATKDISYNLTSNLINSIVDVNDLIASKSKDVDVLLYKSLSLKKILDDDYKLLSSDNNPLDASSFKKDLYSFREQNNNFYNLLNKNIDSSLDDIRYYYFVLDSLEYDLDRKIKERDEVKSTLQSEFENNNCYSYSYIDLSLYYDNPDYVTSFLESNDNPVCSVIYTSQNNLDVCTGDLDSAKNNVTIIKSKLKNTENNLVSFKRESSSVFSNNEFYFVNVEKKVNLLSKFNEDLKKDLLSMSEGVDYNIKFLKSFNDSLNEITSKTEKLSSLKAKSLVDPISNKIVGFDKNKKVIDYFFPTILLFIIMFVGIILGDILTVKEKKSRAMFRNLISPTKYDFLLFGTFLTGFLVILAQSFFVILFALLFLHLSVEISFLSFIFVLFSSISLFVLIGMIIGNLSRSEDASVVISVLLGLSLLVFSNAIQPVETMPSTVAFFVKLNPFYIFSKMLNESFIFGISNFNSINNILLVLLYLFIAVILVKITNEYSNNIIKNN